jgi:hypothetical protein
MAPRFVVRIGDGPVGLPRFGVGAGVRAARALLPLGGHVRIGVGLDVAYDRIAQDLSSPSRAQLSLSHTSFAGAAIFDALLGRARPFVAIGGGLSIGTFGGTSGQLVEALGLVHAAAGVGVRVYRSFELGVHGEVDATFSSTTAVGSSGPPAKVFQPGLFAAGVDLGFRF